MSKRETWIKFINQASTGLVMAIKRSGLEPQVTNNYHSFVRTQYVNYLNICWMSLLKQNDAYVINTFKEIGYKSPKCVLFTMACVGNEILPNKPIVIPTAGDVTIDPKDEEYYTRFNISLLMERELVKYDFEGMVEQCDGKTLEEEIELWKRGGCKEQELDFSDIYNK
ncbi:hypothetical protein ABK040_003108 [Willaertia magna]